MNSTNTVSNIRDPIDEFVERQDASMLPTIHKDASAILSWYVNMYMKWIGELTKIGCPREYKREIHELLQNGTTSETMEQYVVRIARIIRLRRQSRKEMKRRRIFRHMKRHDEQKVGWWGNLEKKETIS